MITRAQVVAEARRWADARTPYAHQGHAFGLACDCGGLPGGVCVALGSLPPDWWARVFDPQFGGYGRQADGSLRRICEAFMTPIPVEDVQPGDCVLVAFPREPEPHHLAIVADYVHGGLSIIHALSTVGRVAEHRLAPAWRAMIVGAYVLPGVA